MSYTKNDILEFLKANHKQRIQIEVGYPNEEDIKYDLTIRYWIDEMELLNWKELSKYYARIFEIEEDEKELRKKMQPIKRKTIEDFCEFISSKAKKPKITPIKLFGIECKEAGIFKYLKKKFAEENLIKAEEIKPSSKIQDYMNEFAFKIVEEVNKINPNALPIIKYEPNEFEKQEWKLFSSGMALLFFSYFIDNWLIAGIGIGLITSGIWLNIIARNVKSDKFEFENIETFRDLVRLIAKSD